jgi:ubiquinone/menaquinone biosynthesis C-methylase UbiE
MSDNRVIIEAFTELASRYEKVVDSELQRFWGWSYEGFIENLIDLAQVCEEDVVLDVATGTAIIPLMLTNKGKIKGKIVALDITLAMLEKAMRKINSNEITTRILLTCGSAMAMPFRDGLFDVILCGLATHHLDVPVVLAEMHRVLKASGKLTIADVGGTTAWRLPMIKAMIRVATFFYFLPGEGYARARSEAAALSNVYTAEEWKEILVELGFENIKIINLHTNHFWSPTPLVICAEKILKESQNAYVSR